MNTTPPYFRLMRLHQPVGIWLLLWPCLWSLAIASEGIPSIRIMLLFGLGAVFMRSAGCVINDMVDREYDRLVERTKTRPLASGEMTIVQAGFVLYVLILLSALIALQLGYAVVLWSVIALIPVALYPFMKRITWWPQLFLGITFNWGALVGTVAIHGEVTLPALTLYLSSIFWTLGYDTIYGHQDKNDDQKVGVKSLSLYLGQHTQKIVGIFYLMALSGWAVTGWLAGCSPLFFALLVAVCLHLGWQICQLNIDDPASCRRIFVSNTHLGGLLFSAFIIGFF